MDVTRTQGTKAGRAAALALACLLALLLSSSAAAAGGRTVHDPRFDTPYLSTHARLDIVKARAGRKLSKVTHTVTMRGRVKPSRRLERPGILINTRGGRRSDWEYVVFGSTVFRVPAKGRPKPVATAVLAAKRRTWRFRFDLDDVRGLGAGYGWAAFTQKRGGRFADVAPGSGYVKSP